MLVEADLVRTDRHTDKTITVTLASACAPRVNKYGNPRSGLNQINVKNHCAFHIGTPASSSSLTDSSTQDECKKHHAFLPHMAGCGMVGHHSLHLPRKCPCMSQKKWSRSCMHMPGSRSVVASLSPSSVILTSLNATTRSHVLMCVIND